MNSVVICTFALILLVWNLPAASAYPSTYSTDEIDGELRDTKNIETANDSKNNRLRRSYYYDDYDYYPRKSYRTPVRRQDDVEYTPLVRYRARRPERKKFFVPNLFG